jgi:hypothetical protein
MIHDMLIQMGRRLKSLHKTGLLLLTLILMVGCQQDVASKASAKSAATKPQGDPNATILAEFWDNGNYLAGKAPNLLFVIWSDGRVVRQLGNGRLYSGNVAPGAVKQFLERISLSGALDSQIQIGVVSTDGNSQMFWTNVTGKPIALRHDSSTTWDQIEQVPLSATPSRRELEAFYEMWTRCLAAIDDLWPPQLTQIMGVPGIQYPGAQ